MVGTSQSQRQPGSRRGIRTGSPVAIGAQRRQVARRRYELIRRRSSLKFDSIRNVCLETSCRPGAIGRVPLTSLVDDVIRLLLTDFEKRRYSSRCTYISVRSAALHLYRRRFDVDTSYVCNIWKLAHEI